MRDHGGNIDAARARWGGRAEDWIDLSTGINRVPYPLPPLRSEAWTALPTHAAMEGLIAAARQAYRTQAAILPLAGAQAAIQLIPRLRAPGVARVLSPTYNEHAASLRAAGWTVEEVFDMARLAGADLAVIVNPNNPDGRRHAPADLLRIADRVGRLVVDESFADPYTDLSLATQPPRPNLVILRSFGKFYGLAGARLGFVLSDEETIASLSVMAGPWPVSGAAIEIGAKALGDAGWARETIARLATESDRIDHLAHAAGWELIGGTMLFRSYRVPVAGAAQDRLARHRIWSRIFPWSGDWLRLGLPGGEAEWARLTEALSG